MVTEVRCPKCDELWSAFASAARDHVVALREQEQAGKDDPARFRVLRMKVEALGADCAAARAKITTHLVLSHSGQTYSAFVAGGH